jgi:hypothetical protein
MNPSTILRDWWLIVFEQAGVDQGVIVAWGIVERDPSMRFPAGGFCCTSPVLEERKEDGKLFAITKNSTYQLIGQGERITMPAKAILALRGGYSPPEIMASKEMKS